MALVIEDGSLVAGANSFASVAQARAYADARGLTLPAADGDVEKLLVKAADFLDSLEPRFKGDRVDETQALAWPRTSVYLFSSPLPLGDSVIPDQLIKAQCQLAADAVTSTLQPNGTGREVIREKVDVIETEYAPTGSTTVSPQFNKAMGILSPLFKNGGAFTLTSVRV